MKVIPEPQLRKEGSQTNAARRPEPLTKLLFLRYSVISICIPCEMSFERSTIRICSLSTEYIGGGQLLDFFICHGRLKYVRIWKVQRG